tara:strand:+ start:940 stop:1326 length:387 start_codon:yes stop_codon:yes gene_type:complete
MKEIKFQRVIQKLGKGINIKMSKKSIKNQEDKFLLELIEHLCEIEALTMGVSKAGVNLFEYEEKYLFIIKSLIDKLYGEKKGNIIIWWVFESITGDDKILPLVDEEKKEHIIKTPKQLLKFLKRYDGK